MDETKAARYASNLHDELDSAALYRAVAKVEADPRLAQVYRRMAEAEDRHARFWEEKLRAAGRSIPAFRLGWRTRTLIFLARRFGAGLVLANIAAQEAADVHAYGAQPEARAGGLPAQEQSHARLLAAITRGTGAGLEGSRIAQLEGRHRALGGNALRAAVLGANDGLLSNFSLVMGVAGASPSRAAVLVAGFAGLLAGACSMALGEWLSVQSARELNERQIEIERMEIEEVPDEEAEELSLIYQAKGLSEPEAKELAAQLVRDPEQALDALAREELGVDPDELGGSAWVAAATSFFLFATGAVIPLAPFLGLSGAPAVLASALLSGLSLFGIGAAITLLTGRSALFTGARQVLFGLVAAGITFGVGRLVGAAVGE